MGHFTRAALLAAAGTAVAIGTSAPATAQPAPPPPGPDVTVQAAADAPPPPEGVPHLPSPENLPPGTTTAPVEPPTGRGLSYLKDLWHAMQTQEVSGRDALLLLTQRPLDPNAPPPPGLSPHPQPLPPAAPPGPPPPPAPAPAAPPPAP